MSNTGFLQPIPIPRQYDSLNKQYQYNPNSDEFCQAQLSLGRHRSAIQLQLETYYVYQDLSQVEPFTT